MLGIRISHSRARKGNGEHLKVNEEIHSGLIASAVDLGREEKITVWRKE